MEIVTKQVDKGLPVDAVYLDFSKAFDKEPHNRLINNIKTHRTGFFVAYWIESQLRKRYQSGLKWPDVWMASSDKRCTARLCFGLT